MRQSTLFECKRVSSSTRDSSGDASSSYGEARANPAQKSKRKRQGTLKDCKVSFIICAKQPNDVRTTKLSTNLDAVDSQGLV
eukprot:1180229-Prorocentrum_minimum.AAC.2